MATTLIGEEHKKIEKSHGGSLNHWVIGLVYITVQTCYGIQYPIMRIIGYMNAPTEPSSISLKHDMEYIMHHPHEPIVYSGKKIYKNSWNPPPMLL